MIDNDFFNASEQIYGWMNKYYSSIENLKNLKQAKPGATPTEEVASIDKIKLLKYKSKVKTKIKTPLLISYALVNRFNIADLQEGKSLIQKLLEQGLEIYIIDWGYPDPSDRYIDLDDYVNIYMDFCVDKILALHNIDKVNLLGICQGGALSICYCSIYAEKIKSLIAMVTPVDFHTKDDILSHMARKVDISQFVDAFGNVPGAFLNSNFSMLQPVALNIKKWIDSVDSLSDEKYASFFLNMENWIKDSPDQAGKAYNEFITTFYQQNKFITGELMIGDKKVNTKKINCPVLNIYGKQDHLVPPASSKALPKIISSKDYTALEIDTGHIGMYVSGKAKDVPNKIIEWLA